MKFEKFVNSGFFRFCEKLYQLIILNLLTVLMIILGLGIFSLLPALASLILIIKSSKKNNSFPFVKLFFKGFFHIYKKAQLTFLLFLGLFLLFGFNTYYFYCFINESESFYYIVAYYITLVADALLLMAFINSAFILIYFPHLTVLKTFKYSFVLLKAVTWKALVMFGMIFACLYLTALFVYILPIIEISIYCYLSYLLLDKDYNKVLPKGMKSLDAFDLYVKPREKEEEIKTD